MTDETIPNATAQTAFVAVILFLIGVGATLIMPLVFAWIGG